MMTSGRLPQPGVRLTAFVIAAPGSVAVPELVVRGSIVLTTKSENQLGSCRCRYEFRDRTRNRNQVRQAQDQTNGGKMKSDLSI